MYGTNLLVSWDLNNLNSIIEAAKKLHGVVVKYPNFNHFNIIPDSFACRLRAEHGGAQIIWPKPN